MPRSFYVRNGVLIALLITSVTLSGTKGGVLGTHHIFLVGASFIFLAAVLTMVALEAWSEHRAFEIRLQKELAREENASSKSNAKARTSPSHASTDAAQQELITRADHTLNRTNRMLEKTGEVLARADQRLADAAEKIRTASNPPQDPKAVSWEQMIASLEKQGLLGTTLDEHKKPIAPHPSYLLHVQGRIKGNLPNLLVYSCPTAVVTVTDGIIWKPRKTKDQPYSNTASEAVAQGGIGVYDDILVLGVKDPAELPGALVRVMNELWAKRYQTDKNKAALN